MGNFGEAEVGRNIVWLYTLFYASILTFRMVLNSRWDILYLKMGFDFSSGQVLCGCVSWATGKGSVELVWREAATFSHQCHTGC